MYYNNCMLIIYSCLYLGNPSKRSVKLKTLSIWTTEKPIPAVDPR